MSDAGGTDVRRATARSEFRSAKGRYMSGSAVGFSGSPRYFTSPTTPTIDNHGPGAVAEPNFTRLPIGSCPGQKRFATRSLTTTAVEAGVVSSSANVRPLTKGILSVLK